MPESAAVLAILAQVLDKHRSGGLKVGKGGRLDDIGAGKFGAVAPAGACGQAKVCALRVASIADVKAHRVPLLPGEDVAVKLCSGGLEVGQGGGCNGLRTDNFSPEMQAGCRRQAESGSLRVACVPDVDMGRDAILDLNLVNRVLHLALDDRGHCCKPFRVFHGWRLRLFPL